MLFVGILFLILKVGTGLLSKLDSVISMVFFSLCNSVIHVSLPDFYAFVAAGGRCWEPLSPVSYSVWHKCSVSYRPCPSSIFLGYNAVVMMNGTI